MADKNKSGFSVAFLAGAFIVLLLIGGLFLLTRSSTPGRPAAPAPLPMGPQEHAYAAKIKFGEFQMSRAQNLLGQEVTYVSGGVHNDGDRTVREIAVLIEFRNLQNQVILRETYRVLGSYGAPLPPHSSRDFQFPFEHIPPDWNVQVPSIRITGLLLQ